MKQIPLRKINEQVPGFSEITQFDFAEQMLKALRAGGLQGVTIEDMERRVSSINQLEAAVKEEAEYVLLEETEHQTLLALVKSYRFRVFLHSAIQMKHEIECATTVEVEIKSEE